MPALESVLKTDDEGVVDLLQNAPLSLGVFDLILLLQYFFLQLLEGELFACLFLSYQDSFAVAALPDHCEHLKIFFRFRAVSSLMRLHDRRSIVFLDHNNISIILFLFLVLREVLVDDI